MENTKKKQTIPSAFSGINTTSELRLYLDDSINRLKSSKYIHHYTTLENVVKMICGGSWHLGDAARMNDKLEYENGDEQRWNNLFFSCFMCEDKESIGMWSMYAQPWEKGVKISLPSKAVRDWIYSAKELWEISIKDYNPTGRTIPLDNDTVSLRLSAVAYSNADSVQEITEEKLMWSNQTNRNIHNAVRIPELTGYVKDMAWAYEKEIRVKAEFHDAGGIQRVAVPLTSEIISQMIITASPLFEGDLQQELEKSVAKHMGANNPYSISNSMKIDHSIFTHRLNIKTICQNCQFKANYLKK